jgi:hypothetical protein
MRFRLFVGSVSEFWEVFHDWADNMVLIRAPHRAGDRVPDPHRPVPTAVGQQGAAVNGEGTHRIDPPGAAMQDGLLGAGDRVPDPHRPAVADTGEQDHAHQGEGTHGADPVSVSFKDRSARP